MRSPGRVRRKLAALLTEATGRQFSPEKLWPAEGWWRSSRSILNESYRWSAGSEDRLLVVDSYDTMTECVRRGIVIEYDGARCEVYAR